MDTISSILSFLVALEFSENLSHFKVSKLSLDI